MSVVLDTELPLDQGEAQVAYLGNDAAQQGQQRHGTVADAAAEPAVHDKGEDQAADHVARHAADRALDGLFRADLGGQLVFAEGHARKVGKGIAGKAENKGQQQIGPVDAGGFHAEEGGEGIADGDTAEQSCHDLGELHLSGFTNCIAEENQCRQNEQHRHKMRAEIITRHRKKGVGKTQVRQSVVLHAADALLQFHGADTRQQAQCEQHHDGRRPQHHPHQHRYADNSHQHTGL